MMPQGLPRIAALSLMVGAALASKKLGRSCRTAKVCSGKQYCQKEYVNNRLSDTGTCQWLPEM